MLTKQKARGNGGCPNGRYQQHHFPVALAALDDTGF